MIGALGWWLCYTIRALVITSLSWPRPVSWDKKISGIRSISCELLGLVLYCRDCPGLGTYDKIVSIEMIEAVGHDHLVGYFNTINAALKPGGKAVIQVKDGRGRGACMCHV